MLKTVITFIQTIRVVYALKKNIRTSTDTDFIAVFLTNFIVFNKKLDYNDIAEIKTKINNNVDHFYASEQQTLDKQYSALVKARNS